MAALPPNYTVTDNSDAERPRVAAYLNGKFVPVLKAEIELTAFGVADTAKITTFLPDTPLGDVGTWSQQDKYFPMVIKAGSVDKPNILYQLLVTYLNDIDTIYDADQQVIELNGRGILAPFEDKRLSMNVDQSVTVDAAIMQVLKTIPGMQYQVARTDMTVGKVLAQNNMFGSINRNARALNYVNMLASTVGWRVRVQGTTVIVGPPAGTKGMPKVPTFTRTMGHNLLHCRVKHSALHAHNVRVRVTTYDPDAKQAAISDETFGTGDTATPQDQPENDTTLGAKGTSGVATGNIPRISEQEEFTYSIPGLTRDQANARATALQEEISRHEFIAEFDWAPTLTDLKFLCANGTEFLINLTGCSQASHNQQYHPKKITFDYSFEGGLICKILAINHIIEQNNPIREFDSVNSPGAPTNTQPATLQQVASLWVQNGGDPTVANLMARVADAESTCNPGKVNPDGGATGLWQIYNHPEDLPPGETSDYWLDPNNNAREAVKLYNEAGGLGPWEASRNAGAGGGWGQWVGKA